MIILLPSPAYLVIAAILLWVGLRLIRSLASPLRKIPGPTISLFTSLLLKWEEIHAARTLYIHSLHEKYGPVVRIAPNEVSFTSWAALKEIYCSGGSGYDKSHFYDLFRIYGRRFVKNNKLWTGPRVVYSWLSRAVTNDECRLTTD